MPSEIVCIFGILLYNCRMRGLFVFVFMGSAVAAFSQVVIFNATTPTDNASQRTSWLAAAGIGAPTFLEDFEGYAAGTNLNGVGLVGGVTITDTNATPSVTAQSAASFFGGSVPDGMGLALRENRTLNFQFAVPTHYAAMLDIDDSGSDVTVFLTDNSSFVFNNLDTTASNGASGEFLGFVSTGLPIAKISFITAGGDGEMGIDNLEYGAVPEPTSIVAVGLGLAAFARRRRR